MKVSAGRRKGYCIFVIAIMFLLLACSVSKKDETQLSAADQVATGVAATQAAWQATIAVQAAEQQLQESVIIEAPTQPEPTLQPTPTQEPTQAVILPEAGLSRVNPLPPNTLVSVPNWDIQVLEYYRGEEALTLINQDAEEEISPPEGMEIVLVKILVRCTSQENEAVSLENANLMLTGSSHISYFEWLFDWPLPELYYKDMLASEEIEGWLDVVVPEGEQNLMAVLDFDDFNEGSPYYGTHLVHYLALEPESAIIPPAEYASRTVNDIGMSPDKPAGVGQLVSMLEWDITLLEAVSGSNADAIMQQDNPGYVAPGEGFEYSLWHFKLQYFGEKDWPYFLYFKDFQVTDMSGSRMSEQAKYRSKSDRYLISGTILPGAVVDGWVILQVPQSGTPYLGAFKYDSFTADQTDETRYFSID